MSRQLLRCGNYHAALAVLLPEKADEHRLPGKLQVGVVINLNINISNY